MFLIKLKQIKSQWLFYLTRTNSIKSGYNITIATRVKKITEIPRKFSGGTRKASGPSSYRKPISRGIVSTCASGASVRGITRRGDSRCIRGGVGVTCRRPSARWGRTRGRNIRHSYQGSVVSADRGWWRWTKSTFGALAHPRKGASRLLMSYMGIQVVALQLCANDCLLCF